jgi:hypothetical protein
MDTISWTELVGKAVELYTLFMRCYDRISAGRMIILTDIFMDFLGLARQNVGRGSPLDHGASFQFLSN